MSYRVLALKWRPTTFEKVVGQPTVIRTLKNALASGRVGHAFLLSGARGVGKTTTARILAKALNCSSASGPTPDPCCTCPSCVEIAAGTSLDVQEIDGATNNSVDQVRELRESARYNPARDRFRIWIIDEVHMLSTGAFNALLKTLEEPPPRVKFIFATTEYHKLPDTILSRCQQYDFRMVPARDLSEHLRRIAGDEAIQVSNEALALIARAAEGSVRDALSLFDQVLSFSGDQVKDEDVSTLLGLIDRELLLAVSQAILEGDSRSLLATVERLADFGSDYRNFARELVLHFREILLLKVVPEDSPLLLGILPEERERMKPLAAAYSEEDLLRALDLLSEAGRRLADKATQDPRVTLELALLKLAQLRKLVPFAELVTRVERLAAGVPASRAAAPSVAATPRPPLAALAAPSSTAPEAATVRGSRWPLAAEPEGSGEAPPAPNAPAAGDPDGVIARMMAQAQSRPSLVQPLRGATARIQGDTLFLEVPADFAAFAGIHIDDYREMAHRALGRPIKVRVGATAASESMPADPEAARNEERKTRSSRDPAVQDVLDLFGGKIVDVREP